MRCRPRCNPPGRSPIAAHSGMGPIFSTAPGNRGIPADVRLRASGQGRPVDSLVAVSRFPDRGQEEKPQTNRPSGRTLPSGINAILAGGV